MGAEQFPMTRQGAEARTKEVQSLTTDGRRRIAALLEEALGHGDLKENAEYHEAKTEQGQMEARIRMLEHRLALATVVDTAKIKSDKIVFGAKVTVVDEETDEEKLYHIVGEDEADWNLNKISITSPGARALIGKAVGVSVEVRAPRGTRDYEILEVEYP